MLKWVVFSKPQEFRKRVVVSQFTFITFLLTYLEVNLLYSKDTFFLNSHRWYAHKKVVVYMAYVIELLKHILSKELKTTDSIAEMKPMVYPIYLLYAIAILFKNKLTICILNNFCC